MKTIAVTIKTVYGCPVVYPADETARQFAKLAGTKTLTLAALQNIKDLGFSIVEVHESKLPEAFK